MNDWLVQNKEAFPIQTMRGLKFDLGDYIKSNYHKRSRELTFSVTKKASMVEIDALMMHIENNYPNLLNARVFIKRKKWDRLREVYNRYDLSEVIRHGLKSKSKVLMKCKW